MEHKFINGFLAGICIALGGVGYLQCPSLLLGSLLFSFGLITILIQQFDLYTGKIGYIDKTNWREIIVVFLGNLCGSFLTGGLFSLIVQEKALALLSAKEALSLLEIFFRSIGCGFIMFLIVDSYKKYNNFIIVMIGIMLFILSGYEHCIAYLAYAGMGWHIDLNILVISIIGNSLGSIIIYRLEKLYELFQFNILRRS